MIHTRKDRVLPLWTRTTTTMPFWGHQGRQRPRRKRRTKSLRRARRARRRQKIRMIQKVTTQTIQIPLVMTIPSLKRNQKRAKSPRNNPKKRRRQNWGKHPKRLDKLPVMNPLPLLFSLHLFNKLLCLLRNPKTFSKIFSAQLRPLPHLSNLNLKLNKVDLVSSISNLNNLKPRCSNNNLQLLSNFLVCLEDSRWDNQPFNLPQFPNNKLLQACLQI